MLTYPDILQRFAGATVITSQDLDTGIRDCLTAGKACSGYSIDVTNIKRKRDGNFWADILNFKRF